MYILYIYYIYIIYILYIYILYILYIYIYYIYIYIVENNCRPTREKELSASYWYWHTVCIFHRRLQNGVVSSGWKVKYILKWILNFLKDSPVGGVVYKRLQKPI